MENQLEKPNRLLTGQQAAKYLGISEQTLRIQRIKGRGIPFIKVGRLVRYKVADIENYINSRTFDNTSQMEA